MPLDFSDIWNTFPVLTTPRLILREFTLDDVDAAWQIYADPLAMKYFGKPPIQDRAEIVKWVEVIQAGFADKTSIRWAIVERESQQYLGSCGFWRIDLRHERAELGYELTSAAWGHGLMSEAVGAMIEYGFTVMNLHSMEANTHPENLGSQQVLKKNGFVQEAYFHENYYDTNLQMFTDSIVFSLLKHNWNASLQPTRNYAND